MKRRNIYDVYKDPEKMLRKSKIIFRKFQDAQLKNLNEISRNFKEF